MKKIIAALSVLLFSFVVVGSAMATGDGRPTSCANWWESFFQGKYVASSYDGYSSDSYWESFFQGKYVASSYDGYSSDSYKDDDHEEKDD